MKSNSSTHPFAAKTLTGCLWAHRGELGPYLFWRIISVVVTIPLPLITQHIIDVSVPEADAYDMLVWSGYGAFLLGLHIFSMHWAIGLISGRFQSILTRMRGQIFQKLQFMHFGFLDRTQTGRLLSKYAFDTNNIEGAALPLISGIIPELVRAVLLVAALTLMNPWTLLFIGLTLPVFTYIRLRYFKRLEAENRAVRLAREKLTGRASEFISAIKLVRGFGQESQVSSTMEQVSGDLSWARKSQMVVNQTMGLMIFTMMTGISILAVAFGGWLVIKGMMTLGMLVAMVSSLPTIFQPVLMLSQFSIQFFLGKESYHSIKELVDSGYVEKWCGERELTPLKGELHFENVSFRYGEDENWVLQDISMRVRAGEQVAFVGPSGSGKSTLVNLVLGLYAPVSGRVLIDGFPQSELSMRSLRQQCAIVMQDNLLLSGSIADNIRFGKPSATLGQIQWAAREANAEEFISKLPNGLETVVGERGVSLSGGQRQRIAIARALLRDPRILILDEATSALDYESEKLVQDALDRLARGRTTITIAHRLSTVRQASHIFVLREGRIIESGSFEELAKRKGGSFSDLLAAQRI